MLVWPTEVELTRTPLVDAFLNLNDTHPLAALEGSDFAYISSFLESGGFGGGEWCSSAQRSGSNDKREREVHDV